MAMAAPRAFQIFNNLCSKLSQLAHTRAPNDHTLINSLLDELNNLDFRYPVVTNQSQAVLLVHQCCALIPTDDSDLVSKSCQLMTNLINRQQVQVSGKTLSLAIQWCLEVMKGRVDAVTIDVLVVLDALLKSNSHHSHSYIGTVLADQSPLTNLAKGHNSPEVILLAVQCLEACTSIPEVTKHKTDTPSVIRFLHTCSQVFINHLTADKLHFDDILYCKMLISCAIGLRNICEQDRSYLDKELGLLLGISRSYMTFGLDGVAFIPPRKLLPSPLAVFEPQCIPTMEQKGGKVVKRRKPRKGKNDVGKFKDEDKSQFHGYIPATLMFSTPVEQFDSSQGFRLKTSDSDFSDSERGKVVKLGIVQGRVRQAALNLLFNIIKATEKHTIFSYWSNFIPDGSSNNSHTLTNCILKDSSPKGRMAALNVLNSLISTSKLFLSQAECSRRETAFTSFSAILGSMIVDLHKWIILALNENSSIVLIHVLKCLASLVQATPYQRLNKGLITKIVRNVKQFIGHGDANVQVAAFIVLGSVLSTETPLNESKEIFLRANNMPVGDENVDGHSWLNNDMDYADFSLPEEKNVNVPWILQLCLSNLGVSEEKSGTVAAPVKLESLQVISAMTKNYFDSLIVPYLSHIGKGLEMCFLDKYADLKLHAGRTLNFIGQSINQSLTNREDHEFLSVEDAAMFWESLIDKSLLHLVDLHQNANVKTIGCDCIGSIGLEIFEQLARHKQLLLITQLFSCSRDEENGVKAASVRALGICVMFPSLRDDSGFIMDVAEVVLRMLNDENVNVKIKSSWSLGNLSDALVLNKFDPASEDIPDDLLLKLFQIALQSINDCDKIKVNAVRALGNLLQLICEQLMTEKLYNNVSEEAIDILVKCSSSGNNVKIRWNACYALGNMLKNRALYESEKWQDSVFETLGSLVIDYRNFKVRISGALALSSPSTRKLYGRHFTSTWIHLLQALDNTENMEDFTEYKHRDNLVDQICLTLGHLVTLIEIEDFHMIQENTEFHYDMLNTQVHKTLERLLPEKSSLLLSASAHLNCFNESNLSNDQRKFINLLKRAFVVAEK